MAPAVVVEGLRKTYGQVVAVNDVSFRVESGETVAILGPNGAGKTTTVEILEGFHPRDSGNVTVLGQDPARADGHFYERVGVVLQECESEPYLSVAELVDLYRGYYPAPRAADEVIELVGLTSSADVRVRRLSGGQRRRLDLALGLIGRPELVFLDEPTTGFDPDARRIAWDNVSQLKADGTTIVLTTHYLEEAEVLADRVVVVVGGNVVADATPSALRARNRDRTRITFSLPPGVAIADVPVAVEVVDRDCSFVTAEPTKALATLTNWALGIGVELEALDVRRPTLEDVYLELTA